MVLLAVLAATASVPDWSGFWILPVPTMAEWQQQLPPFSEGGRKRYEAAIVPDSEPDPLRWCRPQAFTGASGGFEGALEFLFSPGRVTMLNEMGLIRRVYTDGRAMPKDFDDRATGFSAGHWEGDTLVVETTHIDPAARIPSPIQGGIPIGRGARITERIKRTGTDTIQFDVEVVAPDIFKSPDKRTRIYKRLDKPVAMELTFCADGDRSVTKRGTTQFDMTPPKDLPPPPGR
jgi:hypothetical protein